LVFSTGFGQEVLNAEPYGGQRELKEFIKNEIVYPTSDYDKLSYEYYKT
jgi:hypothetical protein